MSVCTNIKNYSRRHEWIADVFSVLAVVVLFATIWVVLEYYSLIFSWMTENMFLHLPLVIAAIGLDVFLIFGFLCIGSTRCENDGCFRTFRGRRHGAGSMGKAFKSWLHHMEHVGKRHR